MKITNTAIAYRTSMIVLTLLLFAGGFYAYVSLPKESNPSITIPQIIVTTIYPGASPTDVASLVTLPIEQEIQGISGLDEVRSTSSEGVSSVVAEFTGDVDLTEAKQLVRDAIDLAQSELPADAEDPIVTEIDLSEFPIMTVNLAADYPLSRLKEVAEDLQDEIEALAGVLEVDLVGGLEREVQVNADRVALDAYDLTLDDLITAIRTEDANIPGGTIDEARSSVLVRVDGTIRDPRVIEDFVVAAPGGTPVYVRDVATVAFGFQERSTYARLRVTQRENEDGDLVQTDDTGYAQVVSLNVKKRADGNIIDIAERVRTLLGGYALPTGTQVLITGDQSEQVKTLVSDLENNIIAGVLCVVIVLLFFLGVRNAMLVGVAIPLSMLLSFIVFLIMGTTLNMVVLFSLIIALGMLVDNAVVIVENIYRFREEGHERWEAAKLATAEVGPAVVASTATTVAVFAPMLFWPGLIGEFMSYLPLTLIVTLTSSLFVALLINPVITGYLVRVDADEAESEGSTPSPWTRRVSLALMAVAAVFLAVVNPITLGVLVIGGAIVWAVYKWALKPLADWFTGSLLPRLSEFYRGALSWMLERDYTVKRAYLRNVGAVGALTLGALLSIVGGAAFSFAGAGAWILLGPGLLLLVVGLLGVFFHTLELVFLGAARSVKAGLFVGVGILAALMISFVGGAMQLHSVIVVMSLPILVVAVGLAGMLLGRGRSRLVLTDNRAGLLSGVLGLFFAVLIVYALAPTGVEFFPTSDPAQISITVEGGIGTNLEASNGLALTAQERVDALLASSPAVSNNVENALVNVGVGGSSGFGGGSSQADRSQITLGIVDYAKRSESSVNTVAAIREGLAGITGARVDIDQSESGPSTGAPVNIELSGPDFDRLITLSEEARLVLQRAADSGEIAGLVDLKTNVNSGRPEEQIVIDRERAARFGLSTQQIASAIRTAVSGSKATTYREGEDEYDVTVRLREADRNDVSALRNLIIRSGDETVPLVSVADFVRSSGVGSITRLDLDPVVTLSGETAPGYATSDVLPLAQARMAEFAESLPAGYTLRYTGENEDQAESFGFLTTALLLGVAFIFLILIAQFNSVAPPFLIMVAVGLSLIGVLLGLILTQTPFGLMTFIGLISLAGIVVNNNIVLVDYAQQLRAGGMDKREAIIEAGATRLRPVLLTALTTVIGLIPLTFGINVDFVGLLVAFDPAFQFGSENTQFWGPMGTTIISGLTFATFLTLVIVPVLYSIFDSLGGALSALFARRKASAHDVRVASSGGDGMPAGAVPAVQPVRSA